MRTTSPERPQEVVEGRHLGQPQRTINFNISEKEEDGVAMYEYNSVTLAPGTWDYDAIVSAMINEIYPYDRMQAVTNNYIAEPEDDGIKAEYRQMQEWRSEAKATARRLLN